MLFVIIERFKRGKEAVGDRFAREGRMLPDDVVYHTSWVEPSGDRCFQIMEAPSFSSIEKWTRRWADICDFEIVPVVTSREFWGAE